MSAMPATHEGTLSTRPASIGTIAREGFLAGVVGYVSVVLAVSALDLLSGRPLFATAAELGNWLFHPVEDALGSPSGPSALAYNGLHLVLSIGVGVVAAAAVSLSERMTGFWFAGLVLLSAGGAWVMGVLGALAVEFRGVSDWPTVVVGTAVWLLAISGALWFAHPRLVPRMRRDVRSEG
jgi:hypothetical protein